MDRTGICLVVLLLQVACMLPHLSATDAALPQNNDSVETVAKTGAEIMEDSQMNEEMHSNATRGSPEHRLAVTAALEEIPSERAIERRMGEHQEVTHGVGYGTHLDPHYYQRRDMGRYYDCALQGPWKPIHGNSGHHNAHGQGAEDGSGHYHQPHPHPHPHEGPHKQNGHRPNNYQDDRNQQLKNIHDGLQAPSGGDHYREVPSGTGQGAEDGSGHYHQPHPHPHAGPHKQNVHRPNNYQDDRNQQLQNIHNGLQAPSGGDHYREVPSGTGQGAEDGSGHYHQPHPHPHPHAGPHKQNGHRPNNYQDDRNQQLKNIHNGLQAPSGGDHYREVPSGTGQGGVGHGTYQNGGDDGGELRGDSASPSVHGQQSKKSPSRGKGHRGGPQGSIPIHPNVPTVFEPENWHQWFFADDYGSPTAHDEDGLSNDHYELAAYHNSDDHVGDGRYTQAVFGLEDQPAGHQGQGNTQTKAVSQEGGDQGIYPQPYSPQNVRGMLEEGQQGDDQSVPYEAATGGGEEVQVTQEGSAPGKEEVKNGEEQFATGVHKLPCQEGAAEEEEESNAADESAGEEESLTPVEEDLSFLEIMYPPPVPHQLLSAQESSAPGSNEDDSQQDNSHAEEGEETQGYNGNGNAQAPVQQAYVATGYDHPPPKCPYAGHEHVLMANSIRGTPYVGGDGHSNHPQSIPPPKQGWVDPRGKHDAPQPVKQYEVYESQDEGEEGPSEGRGHQHVQGQQLQPADYGGDEGQGPVFGQRIPIKQGAQHIHGEVLPSGAESGEPYVPHNSLAEDLSYPQEQQIGATVLKPPPMVLRDAVAKGNALKVLVESRRKRRPLAWTGMRSGRFPMAPGKMPAPFLMKARRVVRRPMARMLVTLS